MTITEVYVDQTTTTGSGWGYTFPGDESGHVIVAALDLVDMGSGDELEVTYLIALNGGGEGPLVPTGWSETITVASPGPHGLLSPPMPALHLAAFQLEQTSGAAFDIDIRCWRVG